MPHGYILLRQCSSCFCQIKIHPSAVRSRNTVWIQRNERDAENLNPHQTLSELLVLLPLYVCVCVCDLFSDQLETCTMPLAAEQQ